MGVGSRSGRYLDVTEYAFLLREPGGAVRAVHETHRLGLFPGSTWLHLIDAAGSRRGPSPSRPRKTANPANCSPRCAPTGGLFSYNVIILNGASASH